MCYNLVSLRIKEKQTNKKSQKPHKQANKKTHNQTSALYVHPTKPDFCFNAMRLKMSLCAQVHVLFSFARMSWPHGSACKERELSILAKCMCQIKTKTDFFQTCHSDDPKTSGQHVCQQSEPHADREIIKMHENMYDSLRPCFHSWLWHPPAYKYTHNLPLQEVQRFISRTVSRHFVSSSCLDKMAEHKSSSNKKRLNTWWK